MGNRERQAALNHQVKAARNDELSEGAEFGCECSDLRCNGTLHLTIEERTLRRRNRKRFWVKPGHEHLGFERVVDRDAQRLVVEMETAPLSAVSS
jgi:hypothetical protein